MSPLAHIREGRHTVASTAARGVTMAIGCLLAVALLCLVGPAAADLSLSPIRWDRAAYDGGADLHAVAFWGGARGVAVGRGGTILASSDGGASWTTASVDATADLQGVCFDPAGGMHAVGTGGTILSSPDGVSWTATATGSYTGLSGIDFADPAHGWAVGGDGTVLATSDAGRSWSDAAVGVDPTATLVGVDFIDPLSGWAWDRAGAVFATRDGGATWRSAGVVSGVTLSAGRFVSATEGWLGGSDGVLAHTVDAGETWAFCSTSVTGTIVSLDFCDPLHGVLLCDDGSGIAAIASTADGGATWETVREQCALNGVAIADGLHAWAVGDKGSILRTVGADEPAIAMELSPATPPAVTLARAMPDGSVLIGWTVVPGSTGYVVRRSIDGGPFDTLANPEAGAAPGIRDDGMQAGDTAAYTVAARFGGTESAPGPVAAAQVLARIADGIDGPAPVDMSCIDCHVVHTTGPTGDTGERPLWCLDCHPTVQRQLAGPDASTRHDLLAADAGDAVLGLSCTDCHSPHASSEATPLIDPDNRQTPLTAVTNTFCFSCHDGELSAHVLDRQQALGIEGGRPADIAVSWGSEEHTRAMDAHGYGVGAARLRPGAGFETGAVLQCVQCHGAHGSTNRWGLREELVPPRGSGAYTGLLVEPVEGGGADMRLFCGGCHLLDLHPSIASGGADLSRWPIDCTECHRHGSGL